jgi:crotonobetainyl-CoA:carnitine CoA-transferase CaiB-like acyl-CoA transferase
VVGLEHSVAGPLCTRILADLGADVIKVERAQGGDFSRHWDGNVHGEGAQFWWLNRGKRSIGLDLKDEADRALFDRLLDSADVLVQNMSPAAADRLGLHAPDFESRHPRLVICDISGYGNATPLRQRKAYDMLVQAESGVMSLTGTPEQPMRSGISVCDVSTGIYAATLVLAALVERSASGRGRRLDIAMFDATVEFLGPMLLSYLNAGVVYPRLPDRHHAIAPYGVFRCRDGPAILLAIEQDAEWRLFVSEVLARDDLADDPRYATNLARVQAREEVDGLVAEFFAGLTGEEAIERLERLGLAYGVLNHVDVVGSHPVLDARGISEEVETAGGETAFALAGLARRLFDVGPGARSRPPLLDEDGDQIRLEFGSASEERVQDAECRAAPRSPPAPMSWHWRRSQGDAQSRVRYR